MTKILLVEDDKNLREIYGVRLLAEGYDIVSAGDGEEALAMAIKERPQLIVSDVMMPRISGFDMLDILRSTTETKSIKVIMMTALSSEDQRARGEALGADRYLVKSQVGIEDVVRTVHDVLGDSLTNVQTAQQVFGAPAPSAIARPVMPVTPRPELRKESSFGQPVVSRPIQQPQPSFQAQPTTAPAQPTQSINPAYAFTPTPQPQQVATPPAQPVYAPTPITNTPPAISPLPNRQSTFGQSTLPTPMQSSLPQPTAPFSSARPASLGDRIIHPLTDQPLAVDVGNLMNQELINAAAPQPTAPQAQQQQPQAPLPNPGQTL